MTSLRIPPWCLHWSSDGELTDPDRQDLLRSIVIQEKGLTAALLTPMLGITQDADSESTREVSAMSVLETGSS